jgi:chaperonin cofactor prefoldin
MLTDKPEHMTDEEWSAFNDDELGEAPKAKYQDDDVVDELPATDIKPEEVDPIEPAQVEVVETQNQELESGEIEIPVITGADEKLQAAATEYQTARDQLRELMQRFDDGEIESSDYNIESRELERKIDKLSGKIETLEEQAEQEQQALESYQARIDAAWQNEVNRFFAMPENKPLLESQYKQKSLEAFIEEVKQDPTLTINDMHRILPMARAKYVAEFGEFYRGAKQPEPVKPQAAKPQPRKVEPPKTLAHIPVAEPNNVAEGRFAPLDNIRDPEQLEKAIARMSESERQLYLRGAA